MMQAPSDAPVAAAVRPSDTLPAAALAEAVTAELGEGVLLRDPQRLAPYLSEWRGLYRGATPFVLRPRDTAEVAAMVRHAARLKVPLVPHGGNTGLVGGQTPNEDGREVVLSTERLDALAIDAEGASATVGAGVVLQRLDEAAGAAGLMVPVSLASRGSAQIGGLISTNAGGVGVLAHGNMRASVLGLEVVLADGRVLDALRSLHKDNVGYDLKHLFIGAEGTLGIITRAVLRLVPRPASREVAMVAVPSPRAALALMARAKGAFGGGLTAFEILPRIGLEIALAHDPSLAAPFAPLPAWAVLLEVSGRASQADALEATLAEALEAGEATDAVLARSLTQADALWAMRESMSEAQSVLGGSIKHDVAVPVAAVPRFLEEATAAALATVPGCRPVPFGHLGDGNIHFNVSQPEGADRTAFLARWGEMNEAVHSVVRRHGGSIAAEHGVGRLKRAMAEEVRGAVERDVMRALKRTLDPHDLMNPGRLVPER